MKRIACMLAALAAELMIALPAFASGPATLLPSETTDWAWGENQSPRSVTSSEDAVTQSPLLGEWAIDKTPGFLWGSATLTTKLDWVRIGFGPNAGFSSGPSLFDGVSITTQDIGRSFVAIFNTEPDLPYVASLLTNGSNQDTVFVTTGMHSFGAAGSSHPESFWASNPTAPADFTGYQITRIELFINNVSFSSPGSDPNHNGIWTDFRIDRKLRIYGQLVPEPASAIGLIPGIMIYFSRRRKR